MFSVDFSHATVTGAGNTSLRNFFAPSANWYAAASYGRLNLSITSDTSWFYHMSTTAAAYSFQRNLTGELHSRYIQDTVNAYLSGGGKTASTPWISSNCPDAKRPSHHPVVHFADSGSNLPCQRRSTLFPVRSHLDRHGCIPRVALEGHQPRDQPNE